MPAGLTSARRQAGAGRQAANSGEFFVVAAQVAEQFVSFAASGFEVELHVFDVELQLIDGILGDPQEAAVQARVVLQAFTERHETLAQMERQLIRVVCLVPPIPRELDPDETASIVVFP